MNLDIDNRIFVIGDSHAMFWNGMNGVSDMIGMKSSPGINVPRMQNDKFIVYRLGAVLAHSMCLYNTSEKGIEKFEWLINNKYISGGGETVPSLLFWRDRYKMPHI